jgi:hypothetical protein
MGVNGIMLQPLGWVSGPAQACYQDPTDLVSRILTSLDPGSLPEGP